MFLAIRAIKCTRCAVRMGAKIFPSQKNTEDIGSDEALVDHGKHGQRRQRLFSVGQPLHAEAPRRARVSDKITPPEHKPAASAGARRRRLGTQYLHVMLQLGEKRQAAHQNRQLRTPPKLMPLCLDDGRTQTLCITPQAGGDEGTLRLHQSELRRSTRSVERERLT